MHNSITNCGISQFVQLSGAQIFPGLLQSDNKIRIYPENWNLVNQWFSIVQSATTMIMTEFKMSS